MRCVADTRIKKRAIPIKDVIRLIIKSAVKRAPFTFNRDAVRPGEPEQAPRHDLLQQPVYRDRAEHGRHRS